LAGSTLTDSTLEAPFSSKSSILLITAASLASVAMEASTTCIPLLDAKVGAAGDTVAVLLVSKLSHCIVFSESSSKKVHASSSVLSMNFPWLMDSKTVLNEYSSPS